MTFSRKELAQLSDEELQPFVDTIMDYPEAVRKEIAREANKRAHARRQNPPCSS